MKNKTTRVVWIVLFLGVSLYYLSFSALNWLEKRKIANMPADVGAEYIKENEQKIRNLEIQSLSLGLDLQGGMHVTLEIETGRLLIDLAGEYADSTLINTIQSAEQVAKTKGTDVLDEFITLFQNSGEDVRLSRYYRSDNAGISRRSSNEEVTQYLNNQLLAAVGRAVEIIRTRIDRFGVTEPSIVRQGNSRIVVELPGVDDEERVRTLLKGTARLEFRLTADPNELRTSLENVIAHYNTFPDSIDVENTPADSLQPTGNALLDVFAPEGQSVIFGAAQARDTADVNQLLSTPEVLRMLPRDVVLLWTAKSEFTSEDGREFYRLIGVRKNVELTGEVIEEASPQFDPYTNQPEVAMSMNREGARVWARITGANIGKPVAIVLDKYVYTFPNVISKINSGRSSITGLENIQEAEDLVNILLSGALPAPLQIIEDRSVGPSLGQASIKAGFNSTMIGLMIVAIFMIFYYRAGGGVADLALVLNIVFIFGILAAFKATLTLPGIAGIVLTIGMAVDANVIIFERIREELTSGKTIKAAVDAGYSHSMSAILDANVTTFLTGAILFSFGVGPIKGFALTLMAGIFTSLFTALIVTRLLVDVLIEKNNKVNFG